MIDHQSDAANTEERLIISNRTPVTGSSLERKGKLWAKMCLNCLE